MEKPPGRHNIHGGYYRPVVDLNKQWEPSPISSTIALPNEVYPYAYDESWTPPKAPPFKLKRKYFDSRAHERNLIIRWLRRLFREL